MKREPYFLDGVVVGYSTMSTDGMLQYFVVADSGHLVPYNQPNSILDVIHKWVG